MVKVQIFSTTLPTGAGRKYCLFKKRNPAMYEQMLSRLIAETKKGQMFGEWNDYGRLADY